MQRLRAAIAAQAARAGRLFRRPPELFWLTLIAALLAAFVLYQYRAWQEDGTGGPSLPKNVELVMYDLEATRSVEGMLQWKLSARLAIQAMHEGSTHLESVRMLLVDRQGKKTGITADTGTILPHGKGMSARSNVEIVLAKATRLHTEALVYDADSALITGSDPVRIESGGISATGLGMQIELEERRFALQQQVRAVVHP